MCTLTRTFSIKREILVKLYFCTNVSTLYMSRKIIKESFQIWTDGSVGGRNFNCFLVIGLYLSPDATWLLKKECSRRTWKSGKCNLN